MCLAPPSLWTRFCYTGDRRLTSECFAGLEKPVERQTGMHNGTSTTLQSHSGWVNRKEKCVIKRTATEFKSKSHTQLGWERKLPEAIRLLNENPSARDGLPPCELLSREALKAPQTMKAVSAAVGCFPELDCKTLLLKTLYVRDVTAGHADIQLGLNRKPLSCCWLS